MNKQARNNIAVGTVVLLLLGGGVVGYRFVRDGWSAGNKPLYVLFNNAQGIAVAEPVQMAGIKIGQVDDVNLTPENRARITLGIEDKYHIPEGSRFIIQAGLLGNSRHIEVVPNTGAPRDIAPRTTVEGVSTSAIDDTLAESKKLVQQGQLLVSTFQKIIADPVRQKRLDTIVANTATISGDLRRTTASLPNVKLQLDLLLADLRTTLASGKRISAQVENLSRTGNTIAGNANRITLDLDATLNENRRTIKSLVQSADEAAAAVAGLTGDVRANINDPALKNKLDTVTSNLQTTSENVASISKRLDNIATQFEALASDQTLTGDVKATVSTLRDTVTNLRDTTASLKNITARVETIRIPGERRRPVPTPTPGPNGQIPPIDVTPPTSPTPPQFFSSTSLLEPGLVFDALYDTKEGRLRGDANYTLLSGRNQFYRLGLVDATERNQLQLQLGMSNGLPATFAYRFGVLSGKFGGGLDFRTGPLDFRVDIFDPNRLQLNLRAKGYLNRASSLLGGIDSVGRENRATFGIQVRY